MCIRDRVVAAQAVEIPVVGNFARQEQLGIGRNGLVDHGVNIFGYILAAQYLSLIHISMCIRDRVYRL